MKVRHHPGDEVLLDYATGALAAPFALIVATHLALCPRCRREVAAYEAIGGALLEGSADGAPGEETFARIVEQLDAAPPPATPAAAPVPAVLADLPRPLRDSVPVRDGTLPWRRLGAVEAIELPCDTQGHRIRLLRIAPGRGVPLHTHRGTEMTLVLQGGYSDTTGRYGPGDLESADATLEHRPVADPGEPCLCLAVTSAPLRLTGRLGRLIDPFLSV